MSKPTPAGKTAASRARSRAAEAAATAAPGLATSPAEPAASGRPAKRVPPARKAAPAAKTAAATQATPTKAAAPTKTAPAKTAPAKAAPVAAAKAAPARKAAPAKRATPARKATAARRTPLPAAPPGDLAVREDESPWTATELADVQAELESDVIRLRSEIAVAEHDLAGLMRDAGDGAGDDQADAGTATFEREQEISLANNSREMLDQSEHALERIALGTYGICESCGNPVGKLRLQAFPRATLCRSCKQKQERR
jgi:RNA polymerase-binding transcription factor DksA